MAAAEEDGAEDLDILTRQKQSRPTFARVISRELTRTPEEVECSRKAISKILETLLVLKHWRPGTVAIEMGSPVSEQK